MTSRIKRLQERLQQIGLPALLITNAENCYYLSNFSGSSGALLITPYHQWLVSDSRYILQAAEEASAWEFVLATTTLPAALRTLLCESACAEIGVEADDMTLQFYQQIGGVDYTTNYHLKPTSGIVSQLRVCKDADELAHIREAVRVTDAAYAHLLTLVRPGITEIELALETEWHMRQHGADGMAFDIIIAAGTRSALPHAQPGDRALQVGDMVVVDMGARVAHYCADMTRTFAVVEASEKAREIYQVCLAAQLAGIAQIHAGMTGREADLTVREVIAQAGYAEAFGHGTGHGIGLEIHEAPRLSRFSEEILPTGAAVTIEPGIYLAGIGGVRIEDSVVVGDNSVQVLTATPKPADLPVYG